MLRYRPRPSTLTADRHGLGLLRVIGNPNGTDTLSAAHGAGTFGNALASNIFAAPCLTVSEVSQNDKPSKVDNCMRSADQYIMSLFTE
jgi:hypothetical protein